MASIIISKIKVRRGTDAQRRTVILDQGELGYTTDTNRLYVGTGSNAGGVSIGSKIHLPIDSEQDLGNVIAEVGDLVWANNVPYQLVSPNYNDPFSWKNVSALLNPDFFEYNPANEITLKNGAVKIENLNDDVVETITVKPDNSTVEFFANNILRVKDLGISKEHLQSYAVTKDKIAQNVLGDGLQGGAGIPITLKLDSTFFYITSSGGLGFALSGSSYGDNITTVKNLSGGISIIPNSINELYINSSTFGNGVSGGSGNKIVLNIDTSIFGFNSAAQLKLNPNIIDENFIKINTFGRGLLGGNGIKPTLNISPVYFGYDGLSALILLNDSIDNSHIKVETFGNGIGGGGGEVVKLKVKENLFDFEIGKLSLSSNSITEQFISSDAFLNGLLGGNNQKISLNTTSNFSFTSSYQLDLSQKTVGSAKATLSSINKTNVISLSSGISFPNISWDDFGRIVNINTSIVQVLTGRSVLSGFNSNNSLSSIFNGSITAGTEIGSDITKFTAIDHNNNTYVLSSAGFLAFDSGTTSLSGQTLKRFAIPIFSY